MVVNPSEDFQALPQMLQPNQALNIANYIVNSDAGLMKRGGLSSLFTVAGTDGITMLEKFTDDLYMYAYGTTLAVYSKSADTKTVIKSNFTTSDPFSGQQAGGYFFICNGGDPIGRISRTITYGTQTANFTVGKILTGGTSGAKAIILQDSDSGLTGTLTLQMISGTFQSGEVITDDNGTPGSATTTSTLTWTFTSISGAPKAKVLRVIGTRLFAGNLSDDPTAVAYCAVETTNPIFTTWTVAATSTSGGKVNFPTMGAVKAIQPLGDNIVVLAEKGKWAFQITVQDVGGTLTKTDQPILQRLDMGGSRATVVTPGGLFYANKGGLWQIMSLGQSNIAFSQQEWEPSIRLGVKYFDDVDLTNADMVYLAKLDTILLTCAKDSTVNNHVIAYNIGAKTFSHFTGWNINRFLNDAEVLYGSGAISNKVWKCLTGSDDDGGLIFTDYLQEIQTGALETRKLLEGIYSDVFISPSSNLSLSIDIYDVKGNFVSRKKNISFPTPTPNGTGRGYGETAYGGSGYGGDNNSGAMTEMLGGCKPFIRNYSRIRLHYISSDISPHQLIWAKLMTREKAQIRIRNMTVTT